MGLLEVKPDGKGGRQATVTLPLPAAVLLVVFCVGGTYYIITQSGTGQSGTFVHDCEWNDPE